MIVCYERHRGPSGELAGPHGRPPVRADSEWVCVAVAQALLGFTSEAHWLHYARKHLSGLFPYLPQPFGHNERLRTVLGLVKRVIGPLASSGDFWIVDFTPVPCGRFRQTVSALPPGRLGRLRLLCRPLAVLQRDKGFTGKDFETLLGGYRGGRSFQGVAIQVARHVLAMARRSGTTHPPV